MHTDSIRFLDSPALVEARSLVQFVVFSRQMGYKKKYIHIYITVFTGMLHDQERSRPFSFCSLSYEIFNEGTKEKKSACTYIAFAYDLILLFFVIWVSQIYLVAVVLRASLKSTGDREDGIWRREREVRRTVILIHSRNLVVVVSPISFVPLGVEQKSVINLIAGLVIS